MIILPHTLRMVAWEITRSCNLACRHCRASARYGPYEGEFSVKECRALLDDIASVGNPVVILTGGEPYLRADIFEIAAYGAGKGLRMVLATNGTMVTREIAQRTKAAGIQRVSISIDGPDPESHDSFRGVAGAFDGALAGIEEFRRAGVEFQINTTITRQNLNHMDALMNLAIELGAAAHHVFLLVPTGRARDMAGESVAAEDYEHILTRFYEKSLCTSIQLKATCAPQYYRIARTQKKGKREQALPSSPLHAMTRGCMGGVSFCFISHRGIVQPCGFLEVECGDLKKLRFADIWNESKVFSDLRNLGRLKGRCGSCEFVRVCGGCRARAYEMHGDYLAEEPFCIYEPKKVTK